MRFFVLQAAIVLMKCQQKSVYDKFDSEVAREKPKKHRSKEGQKTDNRVTVVQITSVSLTTNNHTQLIVLLAGSFGDVVTFEDRNPPWIVSTKQYRSCALRRIVTDLNPYIRRRWTSDKFLLPHMVLHDITTTESCPPFTGLGYGQLTGTPEGANLCYTQKDTSYEIRARFVDKCGRISLEIERVPGEVLDSVLLEKITQVL